MTGVFALKVAAYRRQLIVQALRDHKGNTLVAARDLGICRKHMAYLMKRMKLNIGNFRSTLGGI